MGGAIKAVAPNWPGVLRILKTGEEFHWSDASRGVGNDRSQAVG
jgi:hypothetical protein